MSALAGSHQLTSKFCDVPVAESFGPTDISLADRLTGILLKRHGGALSFTFGQQYIWLTLLHLEFAITQP
jgi:hypothetical protein